MYLTDDVANLIADVTGHRPHTPVAVRGAGGGGNEGSASTTPDTLFSTATIRLVDLLGEGEIVGVRGGLKGVYLNDITVQNADGSFNFKGVSAEFRNGTASQTYMAGYPDVQTPKSVGVKVQQQTPVIASISETEATRVRVTLQFPALFLAKNDGSVNNNSVQYRVEARYSGGPWVNQIGDRTLTGKTTSGYFRSHDVNLPVNPSGASAPWQIRTTRLSPDTEDFNNRQNKYTNQSDLIFYSTTSIVDAKFGYPNSALVGITAQASSFGSSVPGRTYLVDGVLMAVPSNYNPVTRAYSGMWDGTFKQAFCNNPAWALYLVLSSDRFGLGDVIDSTAIDKWSLYEIAKYCDVMVPDGKGGQEPRFTFNGVISTQQEAFELLQLIAQVFQGFNYWSSGAVTSTQDRPADPILLVTEANVVDGEISYASSGRRARHTVAIVAWNDPSNLYKTEYEVVEDRDGLARYGYNPVRVDVLGCTSRGQAHRAGLWKLFTELQQTQVVTYVAGLDHAVARPGDIVAVQDPQIANLDVSGRLLPSSSTNLVLDRPVTLVGGNTYTVSVVLPDGTVGTATVDSGTTGTVSTLPLSPGLSATPDPAAVWLLAGPVKPQQFRIITIREAEPHKYAVTAFQHEPTKYTAVDNGVSFETQTYSTFPTTVAAPINLSVRENQYSDLGQPKQGLTLSWTAGDALTASGYYLTAIRPNGTILDLPRRTSATADFTDVELGDWTFFVTAYGLNGRTSTTTQLSYTVVGWAGQSPTTVTGLQAVGGGNTFGGRSCTVSWQNTLAADTSPYPVRNAVFVYDASTNVILHKDVLATGQTSWTYDYQVNVNEGGPRRSFRIGVSAFSATGVDGPQTSLAVNNPPPAAIVPGLSATSENVFVALPAVNDKDFSGYLVWVSTTSGFTPTNANVTNDDASTLQTFKGANNTTYYVRAAAYDAFSKTVSDLNVSAEYSITCTATAFDTTAPAVPTGLTVGSNTVDVGADGTVTSRVQVNWTAVTSPNLGKYEVAYAPGNNPVDGAYLAGTFVSGNAALRPGLTPGQVYSVKVRSISQNGFGISGWSTPLVFTAAANLSAPDPVTNLTVTSAFQNAFLSWTNPTNTDLGLVEIWAGASNVLANATKISSVAAPGSSFTDNTLGTVASRYYWARSVNTSKAPAASYAGPVLATSAAIQSAQIAAQAVDTNAIKLGAVTASKLTITSQNLAYNADGNQGIIGIDAQAPAGVNYGTGQDRQSPDGMLRTYLYVVNDLPAGQVIRIDNKRYNTENINQNYDVTAGQWYELAASFAGNTNRNYVQITWYDGNVAAISTATGSPVDIAFQVGGRVDIYNRSRLIAQAPSGAVTARISGVSTQVSGGQPAVATAPFVIGWTGWMFASAQAGQVENSLYVDWNPTVLNGGYLITGSVNANKITAGSITTDRMTAGSINADRLVAQSITTALLATDVLTANNITVGNGNLISLFAGNNTTTINGGALTANTVAANRLTIGNRGLSVSGCEFQTERDPGTGAFTGNVLWTGGYVLYTGDDGNPAFSQFSAGSVNFPGGAGYIFWDRTSPSVLSTTQNFAAAQTGPNRVIFCVVNSNASLQIVYGGTIIDGSKITTLSIDTAQLRAGIITADKIAALAITAGKIAADAVVASNIAADAITAKHIVLRDPSNMLQNGDFFDGTPFGWFQVNGTIDTVSGQDPGGLHRVVSTVDYAAISKFYAVTPGDVLYMSGMVSNTRSAGNAYMQCNWHDASGNYISNSQTPYVTGKNAWNRIEGQGFVPAGATSVQLFLIATVDNAANCFWGKLQLRRASGASLIVDGSITARHVATASLTADKIVVTALSAFTVNAGTLTAGNLQSADGKTVFNLTNGNLTISD